MAFKATRTGDMVDGIYNRQPGRDIFTVVDTGTNGPVDRPGGTASTITEVGIEREGLRGDWLVINAKMAIEGGTEDDGMAGVYITRVPR